MRYWLMKSEPETFGIDDLCARPQQTEHWDGVRNYQARNMMRDEMKIGDQIFFLPLQLRRARHRRIAEVTRESYPDFTAFDPDDKHFDPKSNPDKPTWFMVDVKFVRKLSRTISLRELKTKSELGELALLRRGNRLSIMPVSAEQWAFILALE